MSASSAAAELAAGIDVPAAGDVRFERVFDACALGLYRYFAVRTSDRHLADDLMQQLWMQARPGGAALPEERIEPWLRAIARNLVRTHWRRRATRPADAPTGSPRLAAELADRLVSADLPPEELERREVRDQLLLAITALAATDQELIVGCYFEELSHAVLAKRLAISERAVEGRLYRARQALREKLADCDDE